MLRQTGKTWAGDKVQQTTFAFPMNTPPVQSPVSSAFIRPQAPHYFHAHIWSMFT